MADKLKPQDEKDAKKSAQEIEKYLTNAVYIRKKRRVILTFKDIGTAFLFKLLSPGITQTSLFGMGKKVTFDLTDELNAKQITLIMKLVREIK